VIIESWVKGISTSKVNALVAAIGSSQVGISWSDVSRICKGLDGKF